MDIFIVEDDLSFQKVYETFFKLKGVNIIGSAIKGEEALQKFANFPIKPDIILMDYRLPDINGLEVSKKIFEADPKARIVMLSGDASCEKKALELGISEFLIKPCSLDLLYEVIYSIKPELT